MMEKNKKFGRSAALHGVGVDLVSRDRVKQFLSRHRDYIRGRFLNFSERRSFKRLSLQEFAEIFTAKEAFFKACGEAWMGLEGFHGMRMKRCGGDHFEMEWRPAREAGRGSPNLQKPGKGRPARTQKLYRGEGHFFRSGDLVGAQAMIWR
jgi:phosphopantetheinyl transferase (holo-ACP synthase)